MAKKRDAAGQSNSDGGDQKKASGKRPLGQRLLEIFFVLAFLVGFGIFAYPTVSDQWNNYRQEQLISTYEKAVAEMTEEDYSGEWEKARNYNDGKSQNDFSADAFSEGADEEESEDGDTVFYSDTSDEEDGDVSYEDCLNVGGDGIMGYIEIPKIDQKIPIYHGTSDEVLQKAAGHLPGTTLPVGGESTHCVIAAHRGLPSAKLFTDLDQMETGDKIYLHILDEVLAYEVDQILPMVDKDDLDTLTDAMQIVEGEDYITLLTCTPYGVNSHRLLVRGARVEYYGELEEEEELTPAETMVRSVQDYYMLYGILIAAVLILLYLLIRVIARSRKRARSRKSGGES